MILLIPYFQYHFLKKELKFNKRFNFSEAEFIRIFFNYFQRDKVMLDVGAHFGETFSPYEEKSWKIYAFEPDPANREKIKPKLHTTEVLDVAITENGGDELTLYTSEESTGISSLASFHHTHKPSVKVKTENLRSFCEEKNISNIDFLKIDTEGFDLFVLKGFPFEKIKPMVILCEFEDNKTRLLNYTYREMGDFLQSKGYKVFISEWYPILRYGVEHQWRSIKRYKSTEPIDQKAWGNFIAINSNFPFPFEPLIDNYLYSLNVKNNS